MRHGAHRSLRQLLAAAVKWQWLDRNVAKDVSNPLHERQEFQPFEDWEEVDALATELGRYGPFVIFSVGTGVRPEEALALDWQHVDLDAKAVAIHRAFAKGRLKTYIKTARSRRRVPLRAEVVEAIEELPKREGILFPAPNGGRIDINNWRSREWAPTFKAAGLEHRRIYDRDVVARRGHGHLHPRPADGHERANHRPDLRPSGARRRRPGPRSPGRLRRASGT